MPFKPYDRDVETSRHRRRLPHWFQEGRTYFVTFRLADSLPRDKREHLLEERHAWLAAHGLTSPDPVDNLSRKDQLAYRIWFSERTDKLLDAGYGSCILAQPEPSGILEQSLRYFDGERYHLDEYVIMPNHVHLLVCPIHPASLSQILQSWKRHSARKINRLIGKTGSSLWLDENFDHIIRSLEKLEQYHDYIRSNPLKAGLREETYKLGTVKSEL